MSDVVFEECLLVPYGAFEPSGGTLVVLAPHPDDEILGAGGLGARTVAAGGRVVPVVLTDGAAGNFSGAEERERYVRIRRDESTRAAAFLGFEPPRFLDFADRSLPESRPELRELLRRTLAPLAPDVIAAPSPAEPHPDHRAAARVAFDLLIEPDTRAMELLFYEVGAPLAPNRLVAIDDVLQRKLDAVRLFASQLRERPFDELVAGLDRYRAMTLPPPIRHAEAFFALDGATARALGWETLCRRVGPERPA
jgi:LmbE family N-acetylglucosaminyl deacetylase